MNKKKKRDYNTCTCIIVTYIELLTPMTPRMEISIARGLAPTMVCHCLSYSREICVCKNRNTYVCTRDE